MSRTTQRSLLVLLAIFMLTTFAASLLAAPGGQPKVTICHVPPGNPDNAHLITVGAPAIAAHLAHGDVFPGPDAPEACGGDDGSDDGNDGDDGDDGGHGSDDGS